MVIASFIESGDKRLEGTISQNRVIMLEEWTKYIMGLIPGSSTMTVPIEFIRVCVR